MSTGTLKTAKTEQEIVTQYHYPERIVYSANLTYGGSPSAIEIPIGGVADRRLQVPDNCSITGYYTFESWNITDGTAGDTRGGEFRIQNDGGTTSMSPTNLSATDGNPTARITNGGGTVAIAANDSADALTVSYTGLANKVYSVRCVLFGLAIAGDTVVPTPQQVA